MGDDPSDVGRVDEVMVSGPVNWVFWTALAFSLAVAFAVALPVNRWMISRGRGHAVVHAQHR